MTEHGIMFALTVAGLIVLTGLTVWSIAEIALKPLGLSVPSKYLAARIVLPITLITWFLFCAFMESNHG